MAEVILFHHAQGLTDGVRAFADDLRAAGHDVHTPDLYEGRTFTELDDGIRHVQGLGFDTIIARGRAAADGLPDDVAERGPRGRAGARRHRRARAALRVSRRQAPVRRPQPARLRRGRGGAAR